MTTTAAILDGTARTIAGAIPDSHIFAAGTTASVVSAAPLVVPIAEDFLEDGAGAAVLCTLGPWESALQPGNERLKVTILCSVWRPLGIDLGQVVNLLLAVRDAIADAFIAHSKAYLAEATVQSLMLAGGPGLVPRTIGADTPNPRPFLTLPFNANAVLNRTVVPQPA
jgi:hypothetical protein